MKTLIINGSLRRQGSTEGVIDLATAHLNEMPHHNSVEVIHLCDEKITICDSCYECEDKKVCWMEDSVAPIVKKMVASDCIIYASPVCAFGVNSLMQKFLERAGVGYLRFSRPLEWKLASIIVTGRRYSHEVAWGQIALNIMLNKMILVGSGFPPLIRNDGKALKNKIIDQEGVESLYEALDKLVEMHQLKKRSK
jgi:multimeric flavodoxin WrbA